MFLRELNKSKLQTADFFSSDFFLQSLGFRFIMIRYQFDSFSFNVLFLLTDFNSNGGI